MNLISKGLLLTAIFSFGIMPTVSYATNGLFMIGVGNKSRAMGGVGIATRLDSLSAVSNPATISGMTNRFDIGADFFRPQVESQLGSSSSKSVGAINGMGIDSLYILPAMGITYRLNDKITLGMDMAPLGGGGTKFEENFFEAANAGDPNAPSVNSILGVELVVGEIGMNIAYKINKTHHVGASAIIAISRFDARGLGLFSSFTPSNTTDNLTNQGKDWSVGGGLRVGWLGDYGDFTLGASYTSKLYMDTYNHYTELFAEGGQFDVPAHFGIGASFKLSPDLLLAVDITHTLYEDVRAVSNLGPNLAGDPSGPLDNGTRELGTTNGLGFGWTNQTVIKIGAQYNLNQNWILRAGWNYGESPINEDREIIFNLVAPATVEHHLTMGGTYIINPTMELNVSYIHAFENEQAGPTYISDDGSNLGSLKMYQDSLGASFSWLY